jgi:hypothetical protein
MAFPIQAGALLQQWLDHDESVFQGRRGAGAALDRVHASNERSPRLGGHMGGVGSTGAIGRPIVGRLVIAVVVAVAVLAIAASAAFAAGELPRQWDPREVAVNREGGNTFLLRPGQNLAGPGDAADVAKVLPGRR